MSAELFDFGGCLQYRGMGPQPGALMAAACTIDGISAKNSQPPWFALQAWTGREGLVAQSLGRRGYEVFYPRYVERRRWSDRIKATEAALFPGYLFCRFDPDNSAKIVTTPGLLRIVSAGRQPIWVDEGEITSLQILVKSFQALQPWPYVHVGQRVTIQSGPLAGVEGVVLRINRRFKLVVSINILQRSVAVEVGSDVVIPVGVISHATHADCI